MTTLPHVSEQQEPAILAIVTAMNRRVHHAMGNPDDVLRDDPAVQQATQAYKLAREEGRILDAVAADAHLRRALHDTIGRKIVEAADVAN